MKVLVTGAGGFVGRHIMEALGRDADVQAVGMDLPQTLDDVAADLANCDAIIHLAGVNRPPTPEEYEAGNRGFTADLIHRLEALGRTPKILISSSTQAALENPYGQSKLGAEQELEEWAARTGGEAVIFRLTNVFGKWVRPNYNSGVGTFCHNIANGLPITVSSPDHEVTLIHIEDVVTVILQALKAPAQAGARQEASGPTTTITLGKLVSLIESFRDMRRTLLIPDLDSRFVHNLYSTYLTYLPSQEWAYSLDKKEDNRGSLAEFLKTPDRGQIFISRTKPGITRGNHYHHCKTEKFVVVEGEAVIRFRHIEDTEGANIVEHPVKGEDYRVVDIPPGWTHSIENVGQTTLITLFWASELFDHDRPDTYFLEVLK